MTSPSNGGTRPIGGDAFIESSFRRLLSAIESEREQIRGTYQVIEQERDGTSGELERLRQDTEDWCSSEMAKVGAEWRRLDNLSENMKGIWSDATDIIDVNCSGKVWTLPRSTLCQIEGSNLSQMFSDAFIQNIPKDTEGRFYIDFNPQCFGIIVDYLRNRRLRPDAPLPVVPSKHQQSMDLLAEALKFTPFLTENQVCTVHGTSLYVTGNVIQAMHPGWQVISSTNPLPLGGASYFEVKILANPNTSGGLAIGVCSHIPNGDEVHNLRVPDSVLYNSHNGLIGDCIDAEDVERGLQLKEGDVISVKNDITKNCIGWYYNYKSIGTSIIKKESIDKMRTMFPVFAMYAPDTRIQVDFNPPDPSKRAMDG